MVRFALGFVLFIGVAPAATNQNVTSPQVSLALPPGIAPETVQINYFMVGPFGGYGSFVRAENGRVVYNITASVNGKPAINVKVIAYLPGCDIETLDIPVHSGTVSRDLSCKPLGLVALHGQIFPASIIQPASEVEVAYLADWDHKFFGIADGMVTTIRVATAVPNQKGEFEVALPGFHAPAGLGDGEFQLTLREIKTRNIIALLQPTSELSESRGLKVQDSYAPLIQFSAVHLR